MAKAKVGLYLRCRQEGSPAVLPYSGAASGATIADLRVPIGPTCWHRFDDSSDHSSASAVSILPLTEHFDCVSDAQDWSPRYKIAPHPAHSCVPRCAI